MRKNIAIVLLSIIVAILILYWNPYTRPVSVLTITSSLPAKGTILKYEDFRGCKVPIKADGQGGYYRWVKDVPWDKFSIEEKFDMARVGGGWLSDKDIQEIRKKYGPR